MSWSAVGGFDDAVDSAFDRWRGRAGADAFAYGASAVGDHGLLWFLIAMARARRPGRHRAVALWALVFSGAVTPMVNSAVKAAVGRLRPEPRHDDPPPARVPTSTSFPSGHSLAAWCAAGLLADGDPLAPAYYLAAAGVSVSRIHLRQHHATDVLAGAALGLALGRIGRRLGRRFTRRSTW
jgi:membrane-associated phospholipid phosphatase